MPEPSDYQTLGLTNRQIINKLPLRPNYSQWLT